MPVAALWAIALAVASAAGVSAQDQEVVTRVSASQSVFFQVDGQSFHGGAVFSWPTGSKHTLDILPVQYDPLSQTRYTFSHWYASAGALASSGHLVTITADPGIGWYNAEVVTEYAITLSFFRCPDPPCASPGTVWVDQAAFQQDTEVWADAGSTVTLDAAPNTGYVFEGWAEGATMLPPIYSFTLNAPTILYPRFSTARAVQLLTSPPGLQILADRAPVTAPVTLEWAWNTGHSLNVVSPQRDNHGRLWVFQSWSDGGAASHDFQVEPGPSATAVTAVFVPAVQVTLLTEPPRLPLMVDGVTGASPRNLYWAPGDVHTVAALDQQTDAAGNPWSFRSWSNGGASTQQLTVSDADAGAGIRLTATYDPMSRIHVDSTPSGLLLSVNNSDCRAPCDVVSAVGATVSLSAPASFSPTDAVRLDFQGWDGATQTTFSAAAGLKNITARYATSYRLTLTTDPANVGTWHVSPASNDNFYPSGTAVSVGLEAASGLQFRGWDGDLKGTTDPATLLMDGPRAVRALLDALPALPPVPTVQNAAGSTPAAAVAAGSIASLFGSNLAGSTESSDANPLPQTLGGVTLQCSGHLIPLLFVSPQQINFQVPSDLPPGSYELEVHPENGSITRVPFEVSRDAPGLFAAAHAGGSPVTADAPAAAGETITLYGTGFGSYQPMPADGFAVPDSPVFPLADALQLTIAGQKVVPAFAGAAPGLIGVAVVQFQMPEDLDTSSPALIMVSIGGSQSNTVSLPLKTMGAE
ncbi:MAG TPA: hypothetical protein VG675_08110 [Bryobacteraceae bacterium]|nr:hypothetical protein [Bryobacteraceae bacterium]